MKTYLAVLILVSLAPPSFASRDRLAKISQAEITCEDGGTVILSRDRTSLLSLALRTDTALAEVRKEDLQGIDFPQLDSLEITWGTFRFGELNGVRYKCVRFRFGADVSKTFGEHPEVRFYFYDEKYHHRAFRRKIAAEAWKVDDPSMSGGMESVLSRPQE
jgi:hypothetical protein